VLGQIRFMLLRRHLATAPPLRPGKSVNQHRGGTPPTNVLKYLTVWAIPVRRRVPIGADRDSIRRTISNSLPSYFRASPRRSPASVLIHTRMIVAVSEALP
jgi:hypothetical protein